MSERLNFISDINTRNSYLSERVDPDTGVSPISRDIKRKLLEFLGGSNALLMKIGGNGRNGNSEQSPPQKRRKKVRFQLEEEEEEEEEEGEVEGSVTPTMPVSYDETPTLPIVYSPSLAQYEFEDDEDEGSVTPLMTPEFLEM